MLSLYPVKGRKHGSRKRRSRRKRPSSRFEPLRFEMLEDRRMLANGESDVISVGRFLSEWSAADIQDNELKITYTVFNQQAAEVEGLLLTTTLEPGVTLESATLPADQNGRELAWSLGTLDPFGRASVELTVSFDSGIPLQLDDGAEAFGTVRTLAVSDAAGSAVLSTGAIDPALLAPTPDANAEDPFIQAKAAELNQDADEIFAFVTQEIGFESYAGSLRGARGTLWSSAGNALDQSSLLVAMLRASGIPSRYAGGALADPLAQELIASMFPPVFEMEGVIPAGDTLANPVNDPQLLAETRDHFWVQFDAGAGFEDADPAFAGAVVGQRFASVSETFDEVPDSLRHTTTLRLIRELAVPASGLLTFGSPLTTDTVLEHTFHTADLVGKPLSIGHFIDQQNLGTPLFTSITNTYSPYVAVGDEALPLAESELIRGDDYQEVISNFPLSTTLLTGLFLELEIRDPDGPGEVFERTLADRIGFDIRQNGGSPDLTFGTEGLPLLSDFDIFTVLVQPSLHNPRESTALADEMSAITERLAELPNDDLTTEQLELGRLNSLGVTRFYGALLSRLSDLARGNLAEAALVRAYDDRPRLSVVSNRFLFDEVTETGRLGASIDLRRDELRVVAYPGQNESLAEFFFRFERGIAASVNEASVLDVLPGAVEQPATQIDTPAVFAAAEEQGVAITVVSSENLSELDALNISVEAKARIAAAAEADKVMFVPAGMVTLNGEPAIGWYEVDLDGTVIGVGEDGGHFALSEYAGLQKFNDKLKEEATRFISAEFGQFSGSVFGTAAILCTAAGGTDACVAELLKQKEAVLKNVDTANELIGEFNEHSKTKVLSIDKGKFQGQLKRILTRLTGITFGDKADPAVSDMLINPNAFSAFPTNIAAGSDAVTASVSAGQVTGSTDTPHVAFAGQLDSNWTTATASGFSITSLSAATATVETADGTPVGAGSVSAVLASPIPARVSGSVNLDVTGSGRLSLYAPATNGLGVSAQWENYTAILSGTAAIELTSGSLTLDGVTLPLDTYRVSTTAATLAGSGATTSPNFIGNVSVDIDAGTVEGGPGDQDLSVGGTAFDTSHGFALSGFSGTATVTADASTDTLQLDGAAINVLRLSASPNSVTTDQNTPVVFDVRFHTSLADTYELRAEAPEGWTLGFDGAGQLTVTPAPGLQGSSFPVHVFAQSQTDPGLAAHTQVNVQVGATAPGVTIEVVQDPLLFISAAGSQVPAAFTARIHNTGPVTDSFDLAFPTVPPGFEVLASATSVAIPAGETAIVGLYLNPSGSLPAPGTNADFTVTTTSASDGAVSDTQTESFIVPEIHGLTLTPSPLDVSAIPGVGADVRLEVSAVGNVAEDVAFAAELSSGLALAGLTPISLNPGESQSLFLTLTPEAATPLNSSRRRSTRPSRSRRPSTCAWRRRVPKRSPTQPPPREESATMIWPTGWKISASP